MVLVGVEAFRDRGQRLADLLQRVGRHGGGAAAVAFRRLGEVFPAPVQPVGAVGPMVLGGFEFLVQALVEAADHRLHVVLG